MTTVPQVTEDIILHSYEALCLSGCTMTIVLQLPPDKIVSFRSFISGPKWPRAFWQNSLPWWHARRFSYWPATVSGPAVLGDSALRWCVNDVPAIPIDLLSSLVSFAWTWTGEWGLPIHPNKCKCLTVGNFFCCRQQASNPPVAGVPNLGVHVPSPQNCQ